jgi:hypothetical protein
MWWDFAFFKEKLANVKGRKKKKNSDIRDVPHSPKKAEK